MQRDNLKRKFIMLCLLLPIAWCTANTINAVDGFSHINIQESHVQGIPKSSSIDATINGHQLTVTFLENLGNVQVEVTTATGGTVDLTDIWTPNCYHANITTTGSYVVTITLGNGDEYYGEFEVTD